MLDPSSREKKPSYMPWVLLGLAVVAAIAYGIFTMVIKKYEEKAATIEDARMALASRAHKTMVPALEALRALESDEKEVQDLETALTWVLYAQDGIIPASGPPKGDELNGVSDRSSVPMVIARAQRDVLLGEIDGGLRFMKQTLDKNNKEPSYAEAYARLALARAESHPGDIALAERAVKGYYDTQMVLDGASEREFPLSKAVVQAGYARANALAGNKEGALNNFIAAAKSDKNYLWAALYRDMASIPPESDSVAADQTLKKLLEANKALMSPRQQCAVHVERARWALQGMDFNARAAALKEGAEADSTCAEARIQLGVLQLDLGHVQEALTQFQAARRIAPNDPRLLYGRALAMLDRGDLNALRSMMASLSESDAKSVEARLIRTRIALAEGNIEEARKEVDGAKRWSPDAFEVHHVDALVKAAEGDAKAAAEALNNLIGKARSSGRGALGVVLQAEAAALERNAKKLEAARGPAEFNENWRALTLIADGMLHVKRPKMGKTAEEILRAVVKNSDLPMARIVLADVLSHKKDGKAEALELATKAKSECRSGPMCARIDEILKSLQ